MKRGDRTESFQWLAPYLLWFVIFWVFFGRAFAGSGGWLIIVLLFTAFPIALAYGVAFTVSLLVRERKKSYQFDRPAIISVATMLIAGFVFGLTVMDGGDTKESVGSVITHAVGAASGSGLAAFSSWVAFLAAVIAVIAAIVSLVLIFQKGKVVKKV